MRYLFPSGVGATARWVSMRTAGSKFVPNFQSESNYTGILVMCPRSNVRNPTVEWTCKLPSSGACQSQLSDRAQQLDESIDVCLALGFGEGEQQAIFESRVVLLQRQAWDDLGGSEFRGHIFVGYGKLDD